MTIPKVNKPSEEEIISELRGFKPLPGDRFYRQIRTAPWLRAERSKTPPGVPSLAGLFARRRWQPIAALGVMLLFVIILILSTPSASVVAQKIVQFFSPAHSDAIAVQVTDTLPIALGTSVPAGLFQNDIDQAERLAGFTLKEIPQGGGDLVFSGAYHDPAHGAVAMRYDGSGFTLVLSQRRVGEVVEYAAIGASAPIEPVAIHGIPGEYVAGGWRFEGVETDGQPTIVTEDTTTLGIYWDPELPQRIIRWREGDYAYEILALGQEIPSKEGLIIIAESVK